MSKYSSVHITQYSGVRVYKMTQAVAKSKLFYVFRHSG